MSISDALNNAASGLRAASRLANTISNNVSNALTPGYAKRSTDLSSISGGVAGTGVRIEATTRVESPQLTGERRLADASMAAVSTRSDAYDRLMGVMGESGVADSLSANATALESSLLRATTMPQSTTLLTDVASAASNLAQSLNAISDEAINIRTDAEAEIGRQVAKVNETLHKVDDLNIKIKNLGLQGMDTLSLQDERGQIIDGISKIIPVRTVSRPNGQVSIYTSSGVALLDGSVWELSFEPSPTTVTPEMTLQGGQLSTLGQVLGATTGTVVIATGSGAMDTGSLAALFNVRDKVVPEFTQDVDAFANDLIERFRDLMPASALDSSGNGLFVDTQSGPLVGMSGRISVNTAIDPANGGEIWRLRDGLSATVESHAGNGTVLQAMSDAMGAARQPLNFASQNARGNSATMASEISAFFAGKSARSDDDLAFLSARQATLAEQETNVVGVDTDGELEFLSVVEQAYSANAKVLTTVDSLMKLLLDI